jgi:Protein kinase domain
MSDWVPGDPGRFAAGSRVAGYWLEEQIGQGPTGTVFRARHSQSGDVAALKLVAPERAADQEFAARLIRDTQAASAIGEPHILPLQAGWADGAVFIVMPYVAGRDSGSLLRQAGPLPPQRVVGIVWGVACALDAAHSAGLQHGDVKPANVLVDTPPGQPDLIYLSDFGQRQGPAPAGPADQQALACVAFELLTGRPPFRRDQATGMMPTQPAEHLARPTSLRADLPPAVDAALGRALILAPGYGYPSCRELAAALWHAFWPESSPPPPRPAPASTPASTAPASPASASPASASPAPGSPAPASTALAGKVPAQDSAPADEYQLASAEAPAGAVSEVTRAAGAGAGPAGVAPPGTATASPGLAGAGWPGSEFSAPMLVGGGLPDAPPPSAPARRGAALPGAESWLVMSRRPRVGVRAVAIAVAAVLVVAAAVAGSLFVVRRGNSKPPVLMPVTVRSANLTVNGDVWVRYQGGTFANAQIAGTIRSAANGEVAWLYGQPFPFAGAPEPVGLPVTLHPAGTEAKARYDFRVTPVVATRYRVEVFASPGAAYPLLRSGFKTIYVTSSSSATTPKTCSRPVCKQALTVSVFVPPAAMSTELGKHWYVYFGIAESSSAATPATPVTLSRGSGGGHAAAPKQLSADEFSVAVSVEFATGSHGYSWLWNACSQDSESADGLGLPGSHGCGAPTIPASLSYLG